MVSLLMLGGGIALDRSQATVGDVSFLRAMIPHHSLAITRSERFNNDDIRVAASWRSRSARGSAVRSSRWSG
ncbi:MAG: hypothetical protein M5T61_20100 [Acidimicrobiia bacterium]|nr:hypothetical protein [Acidimicrobiia bacterium]